MTELVVTEPQPYGATSRRRRRLLSLLALAAASLLAGTAVGWAAATVLTPAEDVLSATAFTTVEVVNGEVGSSINLNTVAEWTPVPTGSNQSIGVVTTVNIGPGQEVAAGAVLFTVNLRPVIIAQGDVPAFQSLSPGMTGADVAQVQSLLSTLGFYPYAIDGKFDDVTTIAVKAWQKSLGLDADGLVRAGDIVFVPSLPTRVALDTEKVKRGGSLGGGEEIVKVLPLAPAFSIPVTETQAGLMPAGTRVEITGPDDQKWDGFALEQRLDDEGGISIVLQGADGISICGDECGNIPFAAQALLRSRIVTVESATGLTVPTAAILSGADGILSVITEDGIEYPVTVITSARGTSVIEGVDTGLKVRVPATKD